MLSVVPPAPPLRKVKESILVLGFDHRHLVLTFKNQELEKLLRRKQGFSGGMLSRDDGLLGSDFRCVCLILTIKQVIVYQSILVNEMILTIKHLGN